MDVDDKEGVISLPVPREPRSMVGASAVIQIGWMSPLLKPPIPSLWLRSFEGPPPLTLSIQKTPTCYWSQRRYIMGVGGGTCCPQDSSFEPHMALASIFPKRKSKINSRGKFPPCRLKLPSQSPGKDPQTDYEPSSACPPTRDPPTGLAVPRVAHCPSPLSCPETCLSPHALPDPKASVCCPQRMGSGR